MSTFSSLTPRIQGKSHIILRPQQTLTLERQDEGLGLRSCNRNRTAMDAERSFIHDEFPCGLPIMPIVRCICQKEAT